MHVLLEQKMLNELPHRRTLRYRFEDHYAYLYFQTFSISNNSYKTWTRKRKNEVIQHIKEDMEFDGDEVEIESEDNWVANKSGNHGITLDCSVTEFGEDQSKQPLLVIESYRENRTFNEKIKEILCGF